MLIDVLDVIRQAGFWPLAPSLGTETQWPGPITGDGLTFDDSDPAIGAASLAQARAMQETLGRYNDLDGLGRQGLLDMPQKDYWHPKMMWYGPCGIGTTRGLQGFVAEQRRVGHPTGAFFSRPIFCRKLSIGFSVPYFFMNQYCWMSDSTVDQVQ